MPIGDPNRDSDSGLDFHEVDTNNIGVQTDGIIRRRANQNNNSGGGEPWNSLINDPFRRPSGSNPKSL
ncbi:MAG: hypothetical protein HRT35_30940 [Algicola sp.]|nr:hypothetical protein [Algicola sp.]